MELKKQECIKSENNEILDIDEQMHEYQDFESDYFEKQAEFYQDIF